MRAIVQEAIEAGALGFSTSRTIAHVAIDGEPVPGTFAAEDELFGIGEALHQLGRGVFELAPAGAAGEDVIKPAKEVAWMRRLSAAIGRPVTFALIQVDDAPDLWRELMDESLDAVADGAELWPQVAGRPTGCSRAISRRTRSSTWCRPTKVEGTRSLAASPRRGATRSRGAGEHRVVGTTGRRDDRTHEPGLRPHLRARPAAGLRAGPRTIARGSGGKRGCTPLEMAYDAMLEDDGRGLLYVPILNYADGDLDPSPRDAAAPTSRARPGRRWRALRRHLRRVDADVHAHALDTRSQPR